MSHSYYQEASRFAGDKNYWEMYFKIIAKHYIRALSKNFAELKEWVLKIQQRKLNDNEKEYENDIKKQLICYFQLYMAIEESNEYGLKFNEDILNNFKRIDDENELKRKQKVSKILKLKEYSVSDISFTLDKLMNVTLSFYHYEEFRRNFFNNIISPNIGKEKEITVGEMIYRNNDKNISDFRSTI